MTLTGADPGATDAVVPAGASVTVGRFTLSLRAFKAGCEPSAVTRMAYQLTGDLTQPKLAAGQDHSLLVQPDGTLAVWGRNLNGQLALGHTTNSLLPQVTALTGVIAAAAGQSHTLVLTNDATVLAAGLNSSGQLGDGTTSQRSTPVPVAGLANVTAVAAGLTHSLALRADGTVWAWGSNASGQLGDGSTTPRHSPVQVLGLSDMVAIGAGSTHSLAVKADGTVWAWGLNTSRQLGDPSLSSRATPDLVPGITAATSVAAGSAHSLALLQDGTVVAWGNNSYGQLGDGTLIQRSSPVPVLTVSNATSVHAGLYFSAVRASDGTVRAWGMNTVGQLANGTTTVRTTPETIAGLDNIERVGLGHQHGLALSADRVLYAWGANDAGELGDGATATRMAVADISGPALAWRPGMPVSAPAVGTFTAPPSITLSSATPGATIRYTLDGTLPTETSPVYTDAIVPAVSVTVTARAYSPTGFESLPLAAVYTLKAATPTVTPSGGTFGSAQTVTMATTTPGATLRYTLDATNPTSASAIYATPLTITEAATLKVIAEKDGWEPSAVRSATFTFNYGTLPTPTTSLTAGVHVGTQTVSLAASSGADIRYTTTGSEPTASSPLYAGPFQLETSGTLKAKAFQSGFTSSPTLSVAYQIQVPAPALSLAAGTYAPGTAVTVTGDASATLRYTLDGRDPVATGAGIVSGTTLTLGRYTLKVQGYKTGCTPSAVVEAAFDLSADLSTASLAAGQSFSVLVHPDGTVSTWGANANGQLAIGSTTAQVLPTRTSLAGIVSASAGSAHVLFRTSAGTVLAAGSNGSGRLGDGTTAQRPLAVPVQGLSDVIALAAGGAHSLALRADGTVWAWGSNSSGQLGDGTTTQRATPVQVSGLTDVTAIAAGTSHSLAVRSDGSVWSWGLNTSRQLADVTVSSRTTAAAVATVSTAISVAAGDTHSLALLSDGTVAGWGANAAGQLGDGTTTLRLTATPVLTLAGAIAVLANGSNSAALREDGQVLTWGANGGGQLGDGTTAGRSVPDAVIGVADAETIAVGQDHALSVTATGELWAWGANSSGQIGDGTTAARPAPVGLTEAGLTWRTPTPTLSLSSGTYTTTKTVTVGHAYADATLRYTADGTPPTEAAATIPVGHALSIDQTTQIRVRAWRDGMAVSGVAAGNYILQLPKPQIAPPTGLYTALQAATLDGSVGSQLHYTLDGSEPTATSSLYTGPFALATGGTIRAKAYKAGWQPSDIATAVVAYNLGILPPPQLTPTGGTFTTAQDVVLTAEPGATIRYTLDGTLPSEASAVATGSVSITASTTVKARSYHPDYSPSAVTEADYVLTGDTTAPTLTYRLSPRPNENGWNNTPVTVSFFCKDNTEVSSCPSNVMFGTDGIHEASFVASDTSGNESTVSVTIKIDTTAPVVAESSPKTLDVTSPEVTIHAVASDALSGLDKVLCGGVDVPISGATVQCTSAVTGGRNAVFMTLLDQAGNASAVGVDVTYLPAVTGITLQPAEPRIPVGGRLELAVADSNGSSVSVDEVAWTTSDESVVSVIAGSYLQGISVGDAVVTATVGQFTASMHVNVLLPSVSSEPGPPVPIAGEVLWRREHSDELIVADGQGPDGQELYEVVPAGTGQPFPQIVASSLAGVHRTGTVLPNLSAWSYDHQQADSAGGVLLTDVYENATMASTVIRAAGQGRPWKRYSRYTLRGGLAQSRSGRVYGIEWDYWGSSVALGNGAFEEDQLAWLTTIDGATGQTLRRSELPLVRMCAMPHRCTREPWMAYEPVAAADGTVHVLATSGEHVVDYDASANEWFVVSSNLAVQLVTLNTDGTTATRQLVQGASSHDWRGTPENWPARLVLLPNGRVAAVSGDGGSLWLVAENSVDVVALPVEAERLIVEDETIFVGSHPTTTGAGTAAFATSGELRWVVPGGLLAAGPLGTVVVGTAVPGIARLISPNGQVLADGPAGGRAILDGWWLETGSGEHKLYRGLDGVRAYFDTDAGNIHAQRASRPPCFNCAAGKEWPTGKGPKSANDPRRVLTVVIDAAWESPLNSGVIHPRVQTAVTCGMGLWNDAQNSQGQRAGVYFELDQDGARGQPDVWVGRYKGGYDAASECRHNVYACATYADPSNPDPAKRSAKIWLRYDHASHDDFSMTTGGPADRCGRVAHELMHVLKAQIFYQHYSGCGQSILMSSTEGGIRAVNTVQPQDVDYIRALTSNPAICTATPSTGSSDAPSTVPRFIERP